MLEAETGFSLNEPVNYAVRAAIEAGVVELIKDGKMVGFCTRSTEAEVILEGENHVRRGDASQTN